MGPWPARELQDKSKPSFANLACNVCKIRAKSAS
jgi:hypothetical protein